MMTPAYDFYVHTYNDNPEPILRELNRHHSEARVVLVSDGDGKDHVHVPFHKFEERLKDKDQRWILRWFDLVRRYDSKIAVKVDPSSICRRGFIEPFPAALFFGSINRGYDFQGAQRRYIDGGAQFLRREFIELIYDQLRDGDFSNRGFRYKGGKVLSVDCILSFLAEKNGVPLTDYGDVGAGPTGFSAARESRKPGYAIVHSKKRVR